jgi:hypothetical protein
VIEMGLRDGFLAEPGNRFPGRDGLAVAPVPTRAGQPLLATVVPLAALLVFNMADVATTHRILGMGGREMNPVAGWLLANGWLMAAKLTLVALVGVLVRLSPQRRWIVSALWLMASFYGAVIAFHLFQLGLAV